MDIVPGFDPQQKENLQQVEKSVTHLTVTTKQLLEILTQWSTGSATDSAVSDIYVRLGYAFNIACRALTQVGVDTSDLPQVPYLLRTILEETLSHEASQAVLDQHLPRISDIIENLLEGLEKKQGKLRVSAKRQSLEIGDENTERQEETGFISSRSASPTPEGFNIQRPSDKVVEQLFRELMVKRGWNQQQIEGYPPSKKWTLVQSVKWTEWKFEQREVSTARESSFDSLSSEAIPSSMPSSPSYGLPPPSPTQEVELIRLLKGAELERQAPGRFADYQIEKMTQKGEGMRNGTTVTPGIQVPILSLPESNRIKSEAVKPHSVTKTTPKKSSVDLGDKFRRIVGRHIFGERSKTGSPTLSPTNAIIETQAEPISRVHTSSTSSLTPDWGSESTKIHHGGSSNLGISPMSSGSDLLKQIKPESVPLENFHIDYEKSQAEPYQSTRYLGHGGSGSVDEVVLRSDTSGEVYARKQVYLAGRRRNAIFDQLKQEALIIRSLNHRHIVEVVGTYTWSSRFSIIMLPVADTDLGKYLEELDSTAEDTTEKQEAEWTRRSNQFNSWTVCLILAIDYLHEMRIKHRDIKPSNILVRNNILYLTDFGTSRIIPEDSTTGTASIYGPMSRRYVAPEALRDSERRGRSTDIFSLGCVFLELATVQRNHIGAREEFNKLREDSTGLSSFAENPSATLQWMKYLGSLARAIPNQALELSFLMLDPDSKKRVTAKQLISVIAQEKTWHTMTSGDCNECSKVILERVSDSSVVHSKFRHWDQRDYPDDPETALVDPPPHDWEAAKNLWLQHHMWWSD